MSGFLESLTLPVAEELLEDSGRRGPDLRAFRV